MADVLLTHSNHVYADPKQVAKMQPYPPLQTILAAAVLEQAGISVALYDPTLDSPQRGYPDALERHQPKLVVVCEDDFNFLSKMCLARNRELAFRMARTARESGIDAVAHGSDASDHADAYLDAGFSAVIIGEVEATLLEFAKGQPVEAIAGLAFRCERGVHHNAPRRLRTDLDSLPSPAWHLVDVERYRAAWNEAHGIFSLNMASSRGCPYRCNWCAKPIYGNSYHARSPVAVAQEMLFLKRAYHPDHIWFADDIFALSRRWTEDFAGAVERLDARLPFKMQSRCDLMTRDTAVARCAARVVAKCGWARNPARKKFWTRWKRTSASRIFTPRGKTSPATASEHASSCNSAIPANNGMKLKPPFKWSGSFGRKTLAFPSPTRCPARNFTRLSRPR